MKTDLYNGVPYLRRLSVNAYNFVDSTRSNRVVDTFLLPVDRSRAASLACWNATNVTELEFCNYLAQCDLPRNVFELNDLLVAYDELTKDERRTFVDVYYEVEAPYCYPLLIDYVKSGKVRSTELDPTEDSDEICKLHWKDVFGVEFQSKGDATMAEGFLQALDSRTFVKMCLEDKVGFVDLFSENWVCCSREILEELKRFK